MTNIFIVTLLILCVQTISAFYLPGIAPKAYCNSVKESDTCKVS